MITPAKLAYRNVSISSASPVRILDEVYAKLLLHCRDATACIDAGDVPGKAQAISDALLLATVLSKALERHRVPEICDNLDRLYRFVQDKLMEGGAMMKADPIADAVTVILSLRGTFAAAAASSA